MSLPTTFHGLLKPDEGEMYDVDILNNNLDAIDLGLVKIDSVNSAANWTTWDFRSSVFTRIRVQNKGIVIAHVYALNKVADALPINTATGDDYGNVAPAGYRPKRLQSYHSVVASAAGRGDQLQSALDTAGSWFIRNSTGGAFTTVVNSIVHDFYAYEWDGVL